MAKTVDVLIVKIRAEDNSSIKAEKTVEAMNGKVWCESEEGKGATFIMELPQV